MSMTIGNWTIEPMYVDSSSVAKSLSIPTLTYATDYSERTKMRGRTPSANADEKYFVNNTGASVVAPEQTVYGRQPIANVYANLDIDSSAQLAQKGGHRAYCTNYAFYSAVNSVSGAEVIIPLRGTMSLDVPDASLITPELVLEALKRLIAHMFATADVGSDLVVKMLRGDLDPTR